MALDEKNGFISIILNVQFTFSNPIHEEFLSATIDAIVVGGIKVVIGSGSEIDLVVKPDVTTLQTFTPYFKTETLLADFDEAFKEEYLKDLLKAVNKQLVKSLSLPFLMQKSKIVVK